jgi:hypothetical protein
VTGGPSLGLAAGHAVSAITLRNTGKAPCSIGGFPRLSVHEVGVRRRYLIPQDHAGASAMVRLAPGAEASAWALYPDCDAFAARSPKLVRALEGVSVSGVPETFGPLAVLPTAWPTPRCVVTVSGLAGGVFRIGPGFSTGGLPPTLVPRPRP